MNHRIITTLDTNDTTFAVERLAHTIGDFPGTSLEIATDVWAVEIEEGTAGAILRDLVQKLDNAGFLA